MSEFTQILTLFLCFIGKILAGNCPGAAIDYPDRSECIYPVNAKTSYAIAHDLCQELGGQLIQIQSIFENAITGAQAQSELGTSSQSYIGVIRGPTGNWTYDDGSQIIYQNWKSGHPHANVSCATLDGQTYQWLSVACDQAHSFICSIPDGGNTPTPSKAPTPTAGHGCPTMDGWMLGFNNTCYYVYNVNLTSLNAIEYKSAEAACQSMGSHLVSIHSRAEWEYVQSIIATDYSSTPNPDCSHGEAVIGLTCQSNSFFWSDGSTFDYDLTRQFCYSDIHSFPPPGTFGIMNDPRCSSSSYWDDWESTFDYYRYVCKANFM